MCFGLVKIHAGSIRLPARCNTAISVPYCVSGFCAVRLTGASRIARSSWFFEAPIFFSLCWALVVTLVERHVRLSRISAKIDLMIQYMRVTPSRARLNFPVRQHEVDIDPGILFFSESHHNRFHLAAEYSRMLGRMWWRFGYCFCG